MATITLHVLGTNVSWCLVLKHHTMQLIFGTKGLNLSVTHNVQSSPYQNIL